MTMNNSNYSIKDAADSEQTIAIPEGVTTEQPVPELEEGVIEKPAPSQELTPEQKRMVVLIVIILVFFLAAIVGSVYYLLLPTTPTERIRDVFIIFMAVQSLLIGLALVILMIQMARLINLLQNEVKPILDSTNETVSSLRGTTIFLSNNLTGPVIKMNEYLAGLSQFIQVIGLARKSSKSKSTKGE